MANSHKSPKPIPISQRVDQVDDPAQALQLTQELFYLAATGKGYQQKQKPSTH